MKFRKKLKSLKRNQIYKQFVNTENSTLTKLKVKQHGILHPVYTFTSRLAEKIVQQWSSCLTQSPWKINPSGSFWSFYYIFYQVRTTAIFSCNWRRFVLESSCQKHQKQYYQTFPRYIVKSFSRSQVEFGVFFQLQQNSQKMPLLITTTNVNTVLTHKSWNLKLSQNMLEQILWSICIFRYQSLRLKDTL